MVSVIVPNYNHALYLKQRVDSVLNQSHQDFELIILDDYSTDHSKEVIEAYKENAKVSHIVYNTKNSGSPFLQWQKGVALAKGEFIWIAESDDYAEPDFLINTLAIIQQDAQLGIVYTDSNIIQNNIIIDSFKNRNTSYLKSVNWEKDHFTKGTDELEKHLIENCTIYNASAVLFRKNALKPIIDEILSFKYAGDWVCYLLIALNYDIYYIAKALNNYRTHENNLTKKSGENYLATIERVKARNYLKKNLKKTHTKKLIKKVQEINLLELRSLFGGLIRGKLNLFTFIKTINYYI
jgi:glycosyltransferase involved in cell wall biosynthesis